MTLAKNFAFNNKNQLIILIVFALCLNANTLFNEYAIDDEVVLTGNTLVQKGIKGIPEILKTDFFHGWTNITTDLSGGRYRPITLVIFALEYQFFGINPFVSHLINILLFILLIALLYQLLQKHIFREQHRHLAFITCLLFIAHPIHTEVIANVKSRDEIITFILLIASSFTFIKYSEKRSVGMLAAGLLCFLFALLTRESAVPFIGLVPLVSCFFYGQTIKKSILFSIPLIGVFLTYMVIRISMVGFSYSTSLNIMNAPFLYASHTEAFATKIFILVKYFWLLVFPNPLSFDYGYNQIPYIGIYSIPFIFSFILLLGLVSYAVITFSKKSIFSFCILFFFITIFLFSNFVIDIGAPLAERFLFQPSLAFCIALAVLYLKAVTKFNLPAKSLLFVVLLLFSAKNIKRNAEWKNNETLCTTDVLSAPNSVRTNQYASHRYIAKAELETNKKLKDEYYKKAINYSETILKLSPHNQIVYKDLGTSYLGLQDYFKAADNWMQVYKLAPADTAAKKRVEMISDILYNEGNKIYKTGNTSAAIRYYEKSVELNDKNIDAWHNLSISYFKIHDTISGNDARQNMLKLSLKNSQGKLN